MKIAKVKITTIDGVTIPITSDQDICIELHFDDNVIKMTMAELLDRHIRYIETVDQLTKERQNFINASYQELKRYESLCKKYKEKILNVKIDETKIKRLRHKVTKQSKDITKLIESCKKIKDEKEYWYQKCVGQGLVVNDSSELALLRDEHLNLLHSTREKITDLTNQLENAKNEIEHLKYGLMWKCASSNDFSGEY